MVARWVVGVGFCVALLGSVGRVEAQASLCQPGARLEGWYGSSWYKLTVKGSLDAQGKCPVTFDGYGPDSDKSMNPGDLRPLASDPAARPAAPSGGGGTGGSGVTGGVPDGSYRCHKLTPGGGLRDVGPMQVRGGRATLPGFPDGWTILQVFVRGTNSRGQIVVALDYRSAAGINDRLDCLPQ